MEIIEERKVLDFETTLRDTFLLGLKNAPSILGCLVLWLLTIWVPYINVGTTIAISSLPIELSRGKVISPLAIFDARYRRYMGEFFILYTLMAFSIIVAMFFMIVPAIVLSISWGLAIFLLLDKGLNPIQAIKASNDATYGSKWTIFFALLIIIVIAVLLQVIFSMVAGMFGKEWISVVLYLVVMIVLYSLEIALWASVYRQLGPNVK